MVSELTVVFSVVYEGDQNEAEDLDQLQIVDCLQQLGEPGHRVVDAGAATVVGRSSRRRGSLSRGYLRRRRRRRRRGRWDGRDFIL